MSNEVGRINALAELMEGYVCLYYSEKDAQEIMRASRVKWTISAKELAKSLDEAWLMSREVAAPKPTVKDIRAALNALNRALTICEKVRWLYNNPVTVASVRHLLDALKKIQGNLRVLLLNAIQAPRRKGRPRNERRATFLLLLIPIYVTGTGRNHGISKNVSGTPDGPFIRFALASLKVVGMEMNPKTLESALRQAYSPRLRRTYTPPQR